MGNAKSLCVSRLRPRGKFCSETLSNDFYLCPTDQNCHITTSTRKGEWKIKFSWSCCYPIQNYDKVKNKERTFIGRTSKNLLPHPRSGLNLASTPCNWLLVPLFLFLLLETQMPCRNPPIPQLSLCVWCVISTVLPSHFPLFNMVLSSSSLLFTTGVNVALMWLHTSAVDTGACVSECSDLMRNHGSISWGRT